MTDENRVLLKASSAIMRKGTRASDRVRILAEQRIRVPSFTRPLATLLLAFAVTVSAAGPGRLEGVVMNRDGDPVTNALVFVYTAAPREGPGVTCPSCYPDCGKRARTGAGGEFAISNMNSELIYRLLVWAKGYRPEFVKDADPLFGSVEAYLRPLRLADVPEENRVIGKIIDPWGRPVAGATLDIDGVRRGNSSSWGGTSSRVDPLSVTDENGEFFINCTNDVSAVNATIEGRALAKQRVWLETGKAHLMRLKEGVTVTGKLLHENQPVTGVVMSMSTQEREASVFMRGFEVATDLEGEFKLMNIPARTRMLMHPKMASLTKVGATLPPRLVETGEDGATMALGDLTLAKAHTIRGRIILADGESPSGVRVHLGLEEGWDYQEVRANEDGAFEIAGLPAVDLSLSVRVPGYRISSKNPNKDWLNEGRILGRLAGDLDNFIIHLEPGERFAPDAGPSEGERYPRGKPLRGASL